MTLDNATKQQMLELLSSYSKAEFVDFIISLNVTIWALVQQQGGEVTLNTNELSRALENYEHMTTKKHKNGALTIITAVSLKGEKNERPSVN